MGAASVAASEGWTLAAPHDRQAQGLIVSAFAHLPVAQALLLYLPRRGRGAWLKNLPVKITDATGSAPRCAAVGFTSTGLKAMGLDDEALATFSAPFVEGMRQADRQRRLGDTAADGMVLPGGPIWSGNAPDPCAVSRRAKPTQTTVHAVLLVYEQNETSLAGLIEEVEASLVRSKVKIVRRIGLWRDAGPTSREHFGFVDGISQPVPYGAAIVRNGRRNAEPDEWHGAPAGDFLMGHIDANGEPAPGPFVREARRGADKLSRGAAPYGYRDLGLDGSYLVVRELHQDVKAFWDSLDRAAAKVGRDSQWLAERVVGRTQNGDPLGPAGAAQGGCPTNGFGFAAEDPFEPGCPVGAHIRRANPRDGLAPKQKNGRPRDIDAKTFLKASNNHRILRRGRKYGLSYEEKPDDERGLLFMAINTDIARQFEFIQRTWMLNPGFAALHDETDPLMGPKGGFTLPDQPVRTRVEVDTFVRLVGGEYFFLPSLPALDYLAQLT